MVKKKAALIKALHDDLQESLAKRAKKGDWGRNVGDFDCGETALKRKITYLRRELLNLEKEIENESPWRKNEQTD